MAQQIIIQKEETTLQAAIVENNRLAEYYVQRENNSPVVGSIYRGVVASVLSGMQAAFVDIGWERNAYLALEDIVLSSAAAKCKPNIHDILKVGQSIVVQIKKEAVGEKGPKVSTELSIQGRVMVLLPGQSQINISKKITAAAKRQELKTIAELFLNKDGESAPSCGVIIRTAAEHSTIDELHAEFQWLCNQWNELQKKIQEVQKPGLIAADQNLAVQIIRDCVKEHELEGIYVNDYALYEMLGRQIASRNVRFKLRWREENLIETFQLEGEIRNILKRKVMLSNGAVLVFDRTEAMHVVDVNTAKFTGKRDVAETIVQTNIEAAAEIAWQMRLRNLSGIILVDFIDMKQPEHQEQVLEVLRTTLRKDHVKAVVHGISHLGLVEITRQKVRAPLAEVLEVVIE